MRMAVKGALALLGMAIGVPLIIFAWLFVEYNYFYPRQYIRLQNEAAEWNEGNWKKGYALRVTVQVESRTALGTVTAEETLICYEKQFAWPGGIKGPPGIAGYIHTVGATFLTVPFGPSAQHVIELRDACRDATYEWRKWALPHVPEAYGYWSYVVPNDKSFQCFMGSDPRTTLGEASRPRFVAIKPFPLRNLMDRTTYASLPKDQDRQEFMMLKSYYWSVKTNEGCWRHQEIEIDACAPEVETVCGRRLK